MTKKQKKILTRIIIAAVLLVAFHFIPWGDYWYLELIAYAVPYLVIGYDILIGAFKNILRGQVFDEKFLMVIATICAFVIGEYPEASAVMLFYQVGELFQAIAVGRSRKSISDLMDICPDFAVVIRDGAEEEVDPSEVELGEIVIVKPGEKIPIDGVIVEGTTSINSAALTGESLPYDKTVGEDVFSGSINLTSVIKVKTTSVYEDSTVAKILELVENSTDNKASSEQFITKFARYYTPAVVFSAIGIVAVCLLLTVFGVYDFGIRNSIYRGLVFLVVSCPCALVVSVPLSFFGGIGGASRQGILVKGSNYLETLAKIDTVVLDKTGTITKGSFAVEDIHPNVLNKDELLEIAALVESNSTHPVAESIVKAYKGDIDKSSLQSVEEIAGKGIKAVVDGKTYYVGNGKLMEEISADYHECHIPGTIIHISLDDQYLGHIVINDEVKPDSKDAIRALKKVGVKKVVMLSGDNKAVAQKVANDVGLDECHAELLPSMKVDELDKFLGPDHKVAFVGDGINDAPVLIKADIGIAMGALGSDAAIEASDIVLMDDKLSKISVAIAVARKTMRIVKQNIILSIAVKVAIMILGAIGLVGMRVAIFGDVGILVIAIINAVRTMRIPSQK